MAFHFEKRLKILCQLVGLCCIASYGYTEDASDTKRFIESKGNKIGDSSSRPHINLLESDDRGCVIEMVTPDFKTKKTTEGEVTFDVLSVPGYGHTENVGSPQLPIKGILLGVPPEGVIEVQIVDEKYSAFPGYTVSPVPRVQVVEVERTQFPQLDYDYSVDEKIYSADTFYPGKKYEAKIIGKIRGLKVACITVYPIHYNPVQQELRLYRKITLQVRFTGTELMRGRLRPSDPFCQVFEHSIINYNVARRWVDIKSSRLEMKRDEWPKSEIQSPAYKIHINKDGVYKLDYVTLKDSGLDVASINPRTLKIHNIGEQIPIAVYGEEDGFFDSTDYIEFYGTEMTGMFTNTNVYWLSYGDAYGLRLEKRDGSLGVPIPTENIFKNYLRLEENEEYWMAIPNGEGLDHWFWKKLETTAFFDVEFGLGNIADTTADCVIKIEFQGKTTDYNVDPDHHVVVYLNDHLITEVWWDGQVPHQEEVTFPQDFLVNGTNTLRLQRPGDTGATVDIVYLNWLEIEYWDGYIAENSIIEFTATGIEKQRFEITGFDIEEVEILDITDPAHPVRITNFAFEDVADGRTVRFEDDVDGEKHYIVLTTNQFKSTVSIVEDQPSNWLSPANVAEYLIITHGLFYNACLPLIGWYLEKGLRTELVRVEDVYDEFNYGIFDQEAIKDFLTYAYFYWANSAPAYVLLVGDGSFDYKDNFHLEKANYIPPHLMETILLGQTASDNWFVCVDGDDRLPDMFIGRICPRSTEQAGSMVNKILHYVTADDANTWNKNALFVADNDGPFESYCDLLAEYLPEAYAPQKVYLSDYSMTDAATMDILSQLNSGCLLTTYIGHGNIDNWAGEYMFEPSNIEMLHNGDVLSFVLTMNCLNGYFIDPKNDYCLAEEFLRAEDRGAIGSYSPTNLGYSSHHLVLVEEFLTALFDRDSRTLGGSTTEAKIMAASSFGFSELFMDMVDTFVLFGDPALELNLLSPRIPRNIMGQAGNGFADLSWDPNWETDLAGYNVYRSLDNDTGYVKISDSLITGTTFRDSGLVNDVTYSFSLSAEDIAGHESHLSNPVSVTPGIPTSVTELPTIVIHVDGHTFNNEVSVSTHPVFRVTFTHDKGLNCASAWIAVDEKHTSIPVSEMYCTGEGGVMTRGWFEYSAVLSGGRHTLTTGMKTVNGFESTKEIDFEVISHLRVEQVLNWPNPLTQSTVFTYQLSLPADVTIKIYTMTGKLIKTLKASTFGSYDYGLTWDGRDEDGDAVANGVYFYKIIAENSEEKVEVIERLIVMR